MNWLQIECPYCSACGNRPSFMASQTTVCDRCGETFVVPSPSGPIAAVVSPLPSLEILPAPGQAMPAEVVTFVSSRPIPLPMPDAIARTSSDAAVPAVSVPLDEWDAVKARLRRAQVRRFAGLAMLAAGLMMLFAVAYVFLQRKSP